MLNKKEQLKKSLENCGKAVNILVQLDQNISKADIQLRQIFVKSWNDYAEVEGAVELCGNISGSVRDKIAELLDAIDIFAVSFKESEDDERKDELRSQVEALRDDGSPED